MKASSPTRGATSTTGKRAVISGSIGSTRLFYRSAVILARGYSTRLMMWMPNWLLTTPTSFSFSRSDRSLNGGTSEESGATG